MVHGLSFVDFINTISTFHHAENVVVCTHLTNGQYCFSTKCPLVWIRTIGWDNPDFGSFLLYLIVSISYCSNCFIEQRWLPKVLCYHCLGLNHLWQIGTPCRSWSLIKQQNWMFLELPKLLSLAFRSWVYHLTWMRYCLKNFGAPWNIMFVFSRRKHVKVLFKPIYY